MFVRSFLLATAVLLFAANASAQKPTVHLYNWAAYVPPEVVKSFEKLSGIKVIYTTFDSNEILEANLRSGKASFDVVVPRAAPFLANQLPDGLYQLLDKSRLANYRNLDPAIMKLLATYDPQNSYSVPWMWGTIGIGYNIEKIKKILPNMAPDSLSLLFDPEIVSKFKDCGVMVLDSPAEMVPAALRYLGLNPDSKSEADLNKAVDAIRAIRPFIRKFTSADFVNQLTQGNICLAFGYSGDVEEARRRTEQDKGRGRITVGYAVPKEGAQIWIDALAIPANAPNPDNAYKLIDYLLDARIAAQSSNHTGYANANAASRPFLNPELARNMAIYLPDDLMAKLYVVTPADRRHEQQRNKAWNSIKGGK
jgi:putrescine transport system substrate-binding protein